MSPVEIREGGTITEVKRGVVKLTGLPTCIMGQVLTLGRHARALVVGFTADEVLALTLGGDEELAVGQRVEVRQQPLRLGVGEALLGRVVAALGEPLDGEPAPVLTATRPVFAEAPGIMTRTPVERQLCTGITAIDTMLPLGHGQRELIIGDRMSGKTALALDALLSQRGRNVVCIYCSIGQSQRKLQQVTELLQERQAHDYTIVVAAPASREASEQFLAPYAACAIGEHFMHQGRDVLVVFDDLSKHAWAYRQLSLLLERPPGREAYPGDMFYVHAQLMERAGQLSPERGGGAMTFLPLCETQQGDVTGYVASNLISMTDGQVYLSSELFYEGVKPAIDVGLSVSRIGSKVQSPLLRWGSGNLRLELVQYLELVRLSRFASAGQDAQWTARHRRGQLLRQLMSQGAHQPRALEDTTLLAFLFQQGLLERLNDAGLQLCWQGLLPQLPPALQTALRGQELLTPLLRAQLEGALQDLLKPYVTPHPGAAADAVPATPAR